MVKEKLEVKGNSLYQQGYSEGYKEGFNEAFKSHEKFLTEARAVSRFEIACKDFIECPYKIKEVLI